eukprot:scaffold3410_cov141-Cylindrotheca_fusiformis.AAC.14
MSDDKVVGDAIPEATAAAERNHHHCGACEQDLPRSAFSKKQWERKKFRRCKNCVEHEIPFQRPPKKSAYSNNNKDEEEDDDDGEDIMAPYSETPPTTDGDDDDVVVVDGNAKLSSTMTKEIVMETTSNVDDAPCSDHLEKAMMEGKAAATTVASTTTTTTILEDVVTTNVAALEKPSTSAEITDVAAMVDAAATSDDDDDDDDDGDGDGDYSEITEHIHNKSNNQNNNKNKKKNVEVMTTTTDAAMNIESDAQEWNPSPSMIVVGEERNTTRRQQRRRLLPPQPRNAPPNPPIHQQHDNDDDEQGRMCNSCCGRRRLLLLPEINIQMVMGGLCFLSIVGLILTSILQTDKNQTTTTTSHVFLLVFAGCAMFFSMGMLLYELYGHTADDNDNNDDERPLLAAGPASLREPLLGGIQGNEDALVGNVV